MTRYSTLFTFLLAIVICLPAFSGNNHAKLQTKRGTVEIDIIKKDPPNKSINLMVTRGANYDTLFHEDFDGDTVIPDQNNGGIMINLDEDGLTAANGRPNDWYWDEESKNDSLGCTDSVAGMAWSTSWLDGFAPGNRNSLTFPVSVTKAGTMLSFSIASYQFPLYVDGITIMISPDGTSSSPDNDTLIQYGQYLSGGGSWFAPTTPYTFGPGDPLMSYFGTDGCQAGVLDPTVDSSRGKALFYEVAFDLSAYVGSTVYPFFWHDSDDDNIILLDDILVVEPQGVGLADQNSKIYLNAFPNPASQNLTVEYGAVEGKDVEIQILASSGEVVLERSIVNANFGKERADFNVSDLSSGVYMVRIQTAEGVNTTKVVIN